MGPFWGEGRGSFAGSVGRERAPSLPSPWFGAGEHPPKGQWFEFGNRSPESPLCRDACLSPREQEEENTKMADEVETRSPALHSKHWVTMGYFTWNGWDGVGWCEMR